MLAGMVLETESTFLHLDVQEAAGNCLSIVTLVRLEHIHETSKPTSTLKPFLQHGQAHP